MVVVYVHRRARTSRIAMCGQPATQERLTDDLEAVTCPACWRVMQAAAGRAAS